MHRFTKPQHGREEDQKQHRDPQNSRFADAFLLVPLEDIAEKHKTENAPCDEYQIGFRGHAADRPEIRNHEIQEEAQ